MIQPEMQKSKTYSLNRILNTISEYNLGIPLRKLGLPKSTVHNWIKNLNLPMHRLRKRIKVNPIVKKRFIHHNQPFLYQYHNIKIRFANRYPGLVYYLKNVEELLPKDIFINSKRISEISKETPTTMARRGRGCSLRDAEQGFFREKTAEAINVVGVSDSMNSTYKSNVVMVSDLNKKSNNNLTTKQNYATKLAEIALQITGDNKERHSIIENFMLINDTATIATEVPVFLKENNQIITGHIDILQIRFNKLYILDYKPEPLNKEQATNQLLLYRKALSNITKIPENYLRLAFFNESGYFEI